MRVTSDSIRRLHELQLPGLGSQRASNDDIVVRLGGGQRGLPLFLIHPVGGGVGCYLSLVSEWQPTFPVYGLRHPAMLTGGVQHLSLQELAQRYLSRVRRLQSTGPYRFAGWSLGGVIAHLMASRAESEGAAVHPVLLIDSPPVGADGRFCFDGPAPDINAPDLRENVAAGLQELVRIETDPRIEREALAITRSIHQSNTHALLACRLGPAVRGIWYVSAGGSLGARGPDSWRAFAREQFAALECTGNHYSIMDLPHVARLAAHCRAWLAAA